MSASLVTRSRRQLFLSTYSLNSNESSIESTGTPPARRHGNSLLGGEIYLVCGNNVANVFIRLLQKFSHVRSK